LTRSISDARPRVGVFILIELFGHKIDHVACLESNAEGFRVPETFVSYTGHTAAFLYNLYALERRACSISSIACGARGRAAGRWMGIDTIDMRDVAVILGGVFSTVRIKCIRTALAKRHECGVLSYFASHGQELPR
jgi:hypothetical protein